MTGIALDGQALELADGFAFVAIHAIQAGVASDQRKAVFMLPDRLKNDAPALHRVTGFAVRAHLAAMDISMAIRTMNSGVRENHLGVTLGAGHILVQPAQRILRFIVIEFRNGADRLPSHRSVAVLAGDTQAAMRAPRNRLLPGLGKNEHTPAQQRAEHRRQAKLRF